MIIRKLQLADFDQVMAIWFAGSISAHPFVDRDYWISHQPIVHDALLDAEVLVAVDGTTVLGFAGLQDDYLAGIFVRDEDRNHGIGTQLLRAIKKSHSSFTLAVYAENERAVRFYRRQGLQIIRRQVDEMDNAEYIKRWAR